MAGQYDFFNMSNDDIYNKAKQNLYNWHPADGTNMYSQGWRQDQDAYNALDRLGSDYVNRAQVDWANNHGGQNDPFSKLIIDRYAPPAKLDTNKYMGHGDAGSELRNAQTPALPAGPNYPDLLKQLQDQQTADQERQNQLGIDATSARTAQMGRYTDWLAGLQNQANPFAEGNRGEEQLKSNVMGMVGNQWANADKATIEDAASRGINTNDPLFAQMQGQNAMNAARDKSGQIGGIIGQNYDKAQGWDTQNRNMQLQGMQALQNGDFGYLNQLQNNYNTQYQHAMQNPFDQYQLAGADVTQRYADPMAQAGLMHANQINTGLGYENQMQGISASNAQWDKDNPALATIRNGVMGFLGGASQGAGQGLGKMAAGYASKAFGMPL